MNDVCLSLLAAPELEEKLLDRLLLNPVINTFASQMAASHGGHLTELDPGEQVLGRGDAVLIHVVLAAENVDDVLTDLRRGFTGSRLRYWLCPVLLQGEL
ncbi:MAG TPA: DUF3240 family protein [Pseudomonadales bacterium]|nr:DUF3240 family protein [Pseudomonadales bacterium]